LDPSWTLDAGIGKPAYSSISIATQLGITEETRVAVKIIAVADRHGLPMAVSIESATPKKVKLAESTLEQCCVGAAR